MERREHKNACSRRKCQSGQELATPREGPVYWPVSSENVIIVSDAHLGHAPSAAGEAFHRFLADVPRIGGHLVINGDLFDFWFEYRRVIPRDAFPILAALAAMRKAGVRLTVIGGNHDRWGGDFWPRELGAAFYPDPVELEISGFRVFLAHGDGLSEAWVASRFLHRLTRLPITAGLFRWIHPDVGFWLADRFSGSLAERAQDPASLDLAAAGQETFARTLLAERPDLDLLILSHTHRPALVKVGERRWYLNPGAWIDGARYAMLGTGGPQLRTFVDGERPI